MKPLSDKRFSGRFSGTNKDLLYSKDVAQAVKRLDRYLYEKWCMSKLERDRIIKPIFGKFNDFHERKFSVREGFSEEKK